MRNVYLLIGAALVCGACSDEPEYDACGTFEAEEILISSQVTGELLQFDASEGMKVEKGMVLGQIDTVQLYLQKVQLEAQLKSLESSRPDIEGQVAAVRTQIRTLNSEKSRVEKLIAKGAAPQKQLDDINNQIAVLEDQLAAQQTSLERNSSAIDYNASALNAQIALLENQLEKCRIKSPAEGTVLAKYVNAGELVTMGAPLMKVADLSRMYLRAYFTSDQLSKISLGQEVDVTADFGGDQQYEYKGNVVWISDESEFTPKSIQTRDSRSNLVYAVKIAVENDGRLKVGIYGEVNL